jgi:phage recombination protein Bet
MSATPEAAASESRSSLVRLPEPVERRGINEAQWRTLMNNLYPGAKPESVMMVWDYCQARRLDPLKKPCHIVPMQVKNQKGDYEWRDVVMPGIYEYRMTATRTGQYLGHSTPVYGEITEFKGVKVPSTCAITVYRWNDQAKLRAEFPVELIFSETCSTKRDGNLNQRWATAPRQMFTKCVEAAALREAFPDELGGTHTVDEMEGRQLEPINVTPSSATLADLGSDQDPALVAEWAEKFMDAMDADMEEIDIAEKVHIIHAGIRTDADLYVAVQRELGTKWKNAVNKYVRMFEKARDTAPSLIDSHPRA